MGSRRPPCYFRLVFLLALAAAGCGGGPARPAGEAGSPAAAQPAGPPKEKTGHEAFQDMFVAARSWARDARPFQLTNLYLKSSTGRGGRAAAWRASFSSASLGKYRAYSYSTVKTDNLHLGVFASHEERYSAESQLAAPPFEVAGFKIDSDKAWEVAEAKGGKAFRAKQSAAAGGAAAGAAPENTAPVTFLLEYERAFQRIAWRVCYDSQCSTSPFTVNVDATTGEVLKVSK